MLKVGDRLTVDGQLVEVTYVMNEKSYGYKPVKEEKTVETETEEIAPKRRKRKV